MSVVIYNGVTLDFLSTFGIRHDPVMDDMVGVDQECTKITIDCSFIIGPGSVGAGSPESATLQVARLKHLLNTPRRGLIYKVNGDVLVSTVAPNGDTTIPLRDVRNGPYASASVTRVIGTELLTVTFHVETYKVDCPEATSGTPVYVSHRWTETVDMNDAAMSKHVRTGRIVARADMIANADQLRGIVSAPLEDGFRRTSSHYELQADGRVLNYRFVDEEQYLMPPAPAAKAEGRFAITCKDGASYWAECTLRLQGGKPTDKTILIKRAMAIALAKITNANPPTANGGFILTGTISEDMFANDVSVRLSAMVQPTRARMTAQETDNLGSFLKGLIKGGLGPAGYLIPGGAVKATPAGGAKAPGLSAPANLDAFKVPKEFGSQTPFAPGTRGSAQLGVFAQAMNDPCLRLTASLYRSNQDSDQTPGGTTVPATITISDAVPDDNASSMRAGLLSNEPDGVYEVYTITTRDTEDENTFGLPIGKKDGGVSVIRVADKITHRRVTWNVVKVGGQPAVPDPQLSDTSWVLTKTQREVDQVEPIADGAVLRFTVAGSYDYVRKGTKTVTLTAGVPPWVDQSLALPFAQAPFGTVKGILEPWLGLTGFILQAGGSLSTLPTGGGIIPGVNG